ncbi:hypothetical protein INR49_000580 [Caranx melampygus]|nr:hypothetical protein INR49_000580 [Caranx melampygus]
MAAKEDLYAKVTPRRQRQSRPSTIKHGSTLDVLLSMGFPKTRAEKRCSISCHLADASASLSGICVTRSLCTSAALCGAGGDIAVPLSFAQGNGNKLESSGFDRRQKCPGSLLFSHVDDPFLDDPLPREYVLYLRPSGPLLQQLSHFWQQSRQSCGKNKAHNIFPHITLCQFFMCADGKVEALADALQTTVAKWKDVHVEPHKKQLHVTLAYHFQASHLPVLEKLAKNVDPLAGCDWLAVLFSRDIRFANHETLQVMYPYVPQNDDELELVTGDFIFMSPVEQSTASEGWVYGTSLGTGLSGLLPENYVSRADESDTWVVHGSHSILNCASPSNSASTVGGILFDGQLNDSLLDSLMDPPGLSGLCPPMQMSRPTTQSSLSRMRLFVCRHGERMDVVFGKQWIAQCFDSKGRYIRSNLNMPSNLPARSGGHRDYDKDCPITVFGSTQARLVGLQLEGKTKIRVEPGLFEWTKWVSGTCLPTWIPPADLAAANLSVDTTYRPHIPISKLAVSESYDTYISRSFQVTREILAECKSLGNTVLIVAHASSLEACTRQIQGLSPQNSKDFVQVVRKIPYLGFCACEEMGETGVWQLVDPPILPLTHGPNHSFNWREMLMQD